ncbi:uncharacterized protein F5147DRAFT_526495, partial [Suillus discolor]
MSTINASTGFAPFQLQLGRLPRMLPPLVPGAATLQDPEEKRARSLLSKLNFDLMEAHDTMIASKAAQANAVNKKRASHLILQEGDRVMLATKHRRREYIQKGDKHVAK